MSFEKHNAKIHQLYLGNFTFQISKSISRLQEITNRRDETEETVTRI